MAATDCMESSNLITCPTCDHSVSQNRGNKRIICPKCGNFYDRDSAVDELRQIRRVNREKQSPNEIKDRDEVMFLNLRYSTGTHFAMNIMYVPQKHEPDKDISFLKQFSFFLFILKYRWKVINFIIIRLKWIKCYFLIVCPKLLLPQLSDNF